jgi:hypothetical protein
MLGSLDAILAKAEAHAAEHAIEPAALLQARLFPDMFPLRRQVQVACDFAGGVSARLAGEEVPKVEDVEQDFPGLRALVASTIALLATLQPAQFVGAAQRQIVTRPGTPRERRFVGQTYLLHYGLPQFFFHMTTAYALLRHNGVVLGKPDYIGKY